MAWISGCWCGSQTCLGSVLLVLLPVFSLVAIVSGYCLLRFDILGCGLLALCSRLSVFSPRSGFLALSDLLLVLALSSHLAVSFLFALACSLCLTRSSLSPSLAVALILVSGFASQSLLVYLSLVSLLVYLLWPFFMLDGPGLSRRRSRSLLLLSLSCLLFFSATSWRRSQPILVTNILSV